MSESNISKKIVEGITNIIKKTIIFEKTERITGIITGFALCSSIFGLFTIYNTYKCNSIKDKITDINNCIKDNVHLPQIYYKILLNGHEIIYKISRSQIETIQNVAILDNKINRVIALLEDKKGDD
jgi:hypothetical protein